MSRRQPRWVYDEGNEPDPRFSLANERTFLAWVRTSLAMMAGGVALDSLEVPHHAGLRMPLALGLIVIGVALCALALVRWAQVERAMRRQTALPAFTLGLWTTAGVVLVGVVLAIALL